MVLLAVPRYSLREERILDTWQNVKGSINTLTSGLYTRSAVPNGPVNDFLQIAVCLTPHDFGNKNLVGVTQRWRSTPPFSTVGRSERVGGIVDLYDLHIMAPRFARAGNSHPYDPDADPNKPRTSNPSLLAAACADSSFLRGILKATSQEIKDFVESNGAALGAAIPLVAAAGGSGLIALAPWLLLAAEILDDILDLFDLDDRLGEQMEHIKNLILGPPSEGLPRRAAGVFTWQLIAYRAFKSQQDSHAPWDAISYAVMETHDYLEQSCRSNVDSIEVFFDATDSRLIAFVDQLIEFEKQQEYVGKAFFGYASLRFVSRTRALIGQERYPTTCAIEVACLRGHVWIPGARGLCRDPGAKSDLRRHLPLGAAQRLQPGRDRAHLWRQRGVSGGKSRNVAKDLE